MAVDDRLRRAFPVASLSSNVLEDIDYVPHCLVVWLLPYYVGEGVGEGARLIFSASGTVRIALAFPNINSKR